MLFVATWIDRPRSLAKRQETRPAHLAYLAALGPRVRIGGAPLDAKGQTPIGSLIMFEAADEVEVRAMLALDPYVKADLFAAVDLKPWRQAVGAPLGS